MRSRHGRPSGSYTNLSSSDAHTRSARVTSINWWGTTRPGGRRATAAAAMPRGKCVRLVLESFEGLTRVEQVIVVALIAVEVLAPQAQP